MLQMVPLQMICGDFQGKNAVIATVIVHVVLMMAEVSVNTPSQSRISLLQEVISFLKLLLGESDLFIKVDNIVCFGAHKFFVFWPKVQN